MLSTRFAVMDDFPQDFWTYHMYTDSWIEVASQPSSSSLSSAASVSDEVITDGLRVQHDSNSRRRRPQRASRLRLDLGYRRSASAGTSSQEEYDESESESDRVLSSSNEALPQLPRSGRMQYSSSDNQSDVEDDDEDENSTAVGYIRNENQDFTPQPNAFSHPPSAPLSRPSNQQTSYFQSRPSARNPSQQRHSYPSQQAAHSPYNMISPNHQADHDAALRASLSTLLSCAAAARGLPKSQAQPTTTTNRNAPVPSSSRVDPTTLRMVPESALPSSSPSPPAQPANARTTPSTRTTTATNTPSSKTPNTTEKHKRRSSRERRGLTKKAKRAIGPHTASTSLDDSTAGALGGPAVSPTLLTWVVSAGVVVLVSALSFSAGYVVGRDAGRAEVEMLGEFGGSNGSSVVGSCASEVVGLRGGGGGVGGGTGLGLRRLRIADAVRVS
ncbi:uncharacterized protein BKCO1_2700054 [Diplodia corticola]|uniref:Uncharacterized protein n=1 Tax=Diplodia corticola TaxID=236234 RepID=A0A1J9R0N3_9PEZI|nr:uncharacterized protein BKCO1_2700054 [Diplodia corticola]OJD33810.1 hypothetical protein BKCO1_2700054 [Diplodia corticola]